MSAVTSIGVSATKPMGGRPMFEWLRDDAGQGLVEYGLIIAVIAVAVLGAMVFLQNQLLGIFSNIGNNLT